MQEIISLIDQLKKAGIQPRIIIDVTTGSADVQAIKTLQASLKGAGIIPEVHIKLQASPSSGTASIPGGSLLPESQQRFEVIVKESKLNCFAYRKVDKAGKPEMVIREPRVQLTQGALLFVSGTYQVGQNDTGNGVIFGTGNIEYYYVVDCPPNPAAVGLYIRKADVTLKN